MGCRSALYRFAVLAIGSLSAIAQPAAAQRETVKMTVDGVERTALVEPGKDAMATPAPLVLAFHSGGSSAAAMAATIRMSRAWPEATIVYPQGLSRSDPGGGNPDRGWQRLPGEFGDQDVRFVAALLKDLTTRYKVDERRVFVTGGSNGAQFAYLLLSVWPNRSPPLPPWPMARYPLSNGPGCPGRSSLLNPSLELIKPGGSRQDRGCSEAS